MDTKLVRLEWDSAFFGFTVAKVEVERKENFDENVLKKQEWARLVYVFSKEYLHLENKRIAFVDKKITFSKELPQGPWKGVISRFDTEAHSYKDVLRLAYLSGTHSRFRLDRNFAMYSFEKLYRTWLDNSIESKNIEVVIEAEKNHVLGFVTVELSEREKSKIGLIAVDPSAQGRGVGSRLLQQAESIAASSGSKELEVATQFDNTPAMNLYKRNGYQIKYKIYIYHYWND